MNWKSFCNQRQKVIKKKKVEINYSLTLTWLSCFYYFIKKCHSLFLFIHGTNFWQRLVGLSLSHTHTHTHFRSFVLYLLLTLISFNMIFSLFFSLFLVLFLFLFPFLSLYMVIDWLTLISLISAYISKFHSNFDLSFLNNLLSINV